MAGILKKMPWAHSSEEENHGGEQEEEGESLATILRTADDRAALTILVGNCMEAMRQDIVDIFDANQTGKKADMVASKTGDQALLNPDVDPGKVDVAEQDKIKKGLEQREKELSTAKFKDLQKAALEHFDGWHNTVLQRVGEVVNTREDPPTPRETPQGRPESPEGARARMKFSEGPQYDEGVDKKLAEMYAPVPTSLQSLSEADKALILHSLLLLLLSLEHYHAHSRVLLLRLTTSLGLSIKYLGHDESKVARSLLAAAEGMTADEETKKKAEENQGMRKWKVGLAAAAGATLIGVTGGLAAPLLAAGVGSVMGGLGLGATAAAGYLGALAGSGVLVGGLFGAYGGRMTGKMMDQYAREVEDFGFVPVRSAHRPRKIEKEFRRLRVGIGISGWITDTNTVVEPWKVIGEEMESFALRWELETLMNLGNSLNTIIKSAAWSLAKREIIKNTVFYALAAGLWPLGLVKASRIIDNPWSVASYRAQKAGEVLADAIINKAQGERPVTLVGYSLGAKVIYTCLQRLAERRAFGLVENAVFIGSPTPSDSADWRMVRSVVAGRVVNVFSTNDYILAFLYRSSSIQLGVAGLQQVENVKGVENYDVSDVVTGHTTYQLLTGPILKKIDFEDVDSAEVEKEQQRLKEEEEQQAKAQQENEKQQGSVEVSEQQVQDLEKEVEKKNEQSYIGWAQEKMIKAGTNAGVAYEKAKAQWFLRRQGPGGKAAAGAAKDADNATSDVNKTASQAGVDAPGAGDVAYQGMKARSEARKSGGAQPIEGT